MIKRTVIFSILIILAVLSFSSCGQISYSLRYIAADAAYNQGKYEKAIKIYKELLEENPSEPMLHWNLGISYYSSGDLLNCSREAVKLRKLGKQDLAKDLEQLIAAPR